MRAGSNQGQVTAAAADASASGIAGRAKSARGDLDRLIAMLDEAVSRSSQQSGRPFSARAGSGRAGSGQARAGQTGSLRAGENPALDTR